MMQEIDRITTDEEGTQGESPLFLAISGQFPAIELRASVRK